MEANAIIMANNTLNCADPSTSWEIVFIGIGFSPCERGGNTTRATPKKPPISKQCKKIGVELRQKMFRGLPLQSRKGTHPFVRDIMAISFSWESIKGYGNSTIISLKPGEISDFKWNNKGMMFCAKRPDQNIPAFNDVICYLIGHWIDPGNSAHWEVNPMNSGAQGFPGKDT